MKGTIVNAVAIVTGSLLGTVLRQGIPASYQKTLTQGLGLSVGLIGLQMALKTQNVLILILSLIIGGVCGEALGIDKGLNQMGLWINRQVGDRYGNVGKGFVSASLIFCVGAMAVVGSIQDGLTGDASTLYAKAMLDGVFSVVFSSTMGIGVALSGVSVLVYQGAITLLASVFSSVLSEGIIQAMTATGGILIVGISLLTLEITEIKIANLLPSIPVAAIITWLWP